MSFQANASHMDFRTKLLDLVCEGRTLTSAPHNIGHHVFPSCLGGANVHVDAVVYRKEDIIASMYFSRENQTTNVPNPQP